MPAIKEKHYKGGVAVAVPDRDGEELATQLRAAIDDITALRTTVAALRVSYLATLAKLDADGGVTDTNYAATGTVSALAAQTLTKG